MNLPLELVPIAGLLAIAWVVNRSLVIVQAHEQVVVTSDGEVVDVLEPGINFVRPFGQELTHYDRRRQTLTMGERVATADGQAVDVRATVRFRADDVRQFHGAAEGFQDRFAEVVRDELRGVVGREDRAELFEAADQLSTRVADGVGRQVRSWGLVVEGVDLTAETPETDD